MAAGDIRDQQLTGGSAPGLAAVQAQSPASDPIFSRRWVTVMASVTARASIIAMAY